MNQLDDAPRHNNPQQHQTQYPLYTATRQSSYNMLISTEEESARQSYEQLRHERLKRERIKRKGHEQKQEVLETLKLKDGSEIHGEHDINKEISYQINTKEQNKDFKISLDIRQNVEYEDVRKKN
ncbi:hypothetical protein RclHR1_02990006 [Rhizophagus clarus]|nr:hypothetical protein RclHR1_02990006 [Rhizophagus clarus]